MSASSHTRSELLAEWIPYPFVVLLLVSRIYVRVLRRSVGADDYCMFAAFIFYTVDQSIQTWEITHGSLNHIYDISEALQVQFAKLEAAEEVLTIIGLALAKTAVALLLPRIIGKFHRYLKWFIYVNITLYNLISLIGCILAFTACDPPKARWYPQLIAEGKASCPLLQVHVDWTILLGSVGAYIDFLLALLPIYIVWDLHLSLKKKIGVCVLLGFGVFAGACSIVKTLQFNAAYGSKDPTYDKYGLALWTTLELPLIIIAGSVPPSNPLFDSLFRFRPIVPGSTPLGQSLGFGSLGSWNSGRNTNNSANNVHRMGNLSSEASGSKGDVDTKGGRQLQRSTSGVSDVSYTDVELGRAQ